MKDSIMFKKISVLLLIIVLISGCAVHYPISTDVKAIKKMSFSFDQPLYYKISKPDFLTIGGPEKVEDVLKSQNYFGSVERVFDDTIPHKGFYVSIRPEWRPPTLPAIAFGYISASTATILPAWTTKDGYDLYFDLYLDGRKVKTFNYRIKRVAGVWIVLLPFVWVNLLTNSEEDAFEAATYQFFLDASNKMNTDI